MESDPNYSRPFIPRAIDAFATLPGVDHHWRVSGNGSSGRRRAARLPLRPPEPSVRPAALPLSLRLWRARRGGTGARRRARRTSRSQDRGTRSIARRIARLYHAAKHRSRPHATGSLAADSRSDRGEPRAIEISVVAV